MGWDDRLGRLRLTLAALAVLTCAGAAEAAERKAVVEGVEDRGLRDQIERAVGETRNAPASRIEARRLAREAAESAEALLRSEGYYDSVIEPDIGEGDTPAALVRIEPGPRYKFSQTSVDWVGAMPSEEARVATLKALSLKPGEPGRAAEVIAAEGRLVAVLQAQGYADSAAAPREVVVDHEKDTVQPTFKISAGPLVRLGAIRLETKGRTNPAWVAYLAPWGRGAVYKPDLVAELERRLLDTGAYDSVTVALSPTPDAGGLRPVLVGLADRPRHSLELGAGYSVASNPNPDTSGIGIGTLYSTGEGPDVSMRWSRFNQLHRADTFSIEARYARIDSRLGVDLSIPHWRSPGLTLKLTAEAFRQDTTAYNQEGGALRADLTRRYGRTSYFTRGVSLVKSRVDDEHGRMLDIATLAALGAFAIDRSDNPLDPHHGWKADVRLEPTVITGDVGQAYVRAQIQASYYIPVGKLADTVAAARVRLGSILGGSSPNVPISNRFFAGGGGSVRGYEYQSVGPHFADDKPMGGISLVETSVELRHRFARLWGGRFGGAVFMDAGSVGPTMSPSFKDIRYAVGAGLRYNLDFAPIRVDVAVPLRRHAGESPFQVYLSIGQSF